jgi:hypothetical protein
MEKTVKIVGISKWLCFPMGYVMYYFTFSSFGLAAAIVLAVIATVAFWLILRREETRLIGQNIAMSIRAAIDETANVDNFIEIKRMKSGIIARVYLINARESAAAVQNAIKRRIDESSFKKYLWVMQLTDMASRNDLAQTQKILNDQLLEQLVHHHSTDQIEGTDTRDNGKNDGDDK